MTEDLYIFQIIGFLILVIICSYLVIRYGLRAFYPTLKRGYVTVLERAPLDHKSGSAIVLVKVGEALLLIGVAQGGVTLLKEISPDILPEKNHEETVRRFPPGIPFARVLESIRLGATRGSGEGGKD